MFKPFRALLASVIFLGASLTVAAGAALVGASPHAGYVAGDTPSPYPPHPLV